MLVQSYAPVCVCILYVCVCKCLHACICLCEAGLDSVKGISYVYTVHLSDITIVCMWFCVLIPLDLQYFMTSLYTHIFHPIMMLCIGSVELFHFST